jgi:site-specific recombinase XerD
MCQGLKPATVKGYFAALGAFYSFLVRDEIMEESANPMRKALPPKVPEPIIEPLSQEQVKGLLAAFNVKRQTGQRNYVMCLLMLDTGLRVSEVASLKTEDVDFDQRRLKVIGKGNKRRLVYIGGKVSEILQGYLEHCRPYLPKGPTSVANGNRVLFPSATTGGQFIPTEISKIMMRRMDKAGIPRAHSSAHRLRHTFAVNFLRGEGNVFCLQRLLGHSTLEMTRRYVRLAEDDLAEAHKKASPVDRMAL